MTKKIEKNPLSSYLVLGLIVVVAIGVVIVLALGAQPPEVSSTSEFGPDASIPRGMTDDGLPYLGNADAPVTMRIYEDLGCHNCRDFFRDTEPLVIENFVRSGKVKIEIYTLAFVNSQSLPGAEAVTCALDQGKFWEFRELLYTNQGVVPFTRDNLLAWVDDLGLDHEAFASCFDREVHKQEIIDKSQQALDVGVTGTPTTEVNGERHVGVIAYEGEGTPGLKQIFEIALTEAGG